MNDYDYSYYNRRRRKEEKLKAQFEWALAIFAGFALFGFFFV